MATVKSYACAYNDDDGMYGCIQSVAGSYADSDCMTKWKDSTRTDVVDASGCQAYHCSNGACAAVPIPGTGPFQSTDCDGVCSKFVCSPTAPKPLYCEQYNNQSMKIAGGLKLFDQCGTDCPLPLGFNCNETTKTCEAVWGGTPVYATETLCETGCNPTKSSDYSCG